MGEFYRDLRGGDGPAQIHFHPPILKGGTSGRGPKRLLVAVENAAGHSKVRARPAYAAQALFSVPKVAQHGELVGIERGIDRFADEDRANSAVRRNRNGPLGSAPRAPLRRTAEADFTSRRTPGPEKKKASANEEHLPYGVRNS